MSLKISFRLLLHLTILLAAFLVQSRKQPTFWDFTNKHIDYPRTGAPSTKAYCNLMMWRRGLTRWPCMRNNTFINSRPRTIQNICRGGGRQVNGNIFESRRRFPVVACDIIFITPPQYHRCQYFGRQLNRRIRVACVNRQPIRFDRLI
ncbi:ribonuclease pancreatic-like [Heteronotia binoei]|uniref:ribonuclease pancreatic-like n=1 Tax=Heteronotia binoei TaxID=13085 RepID=UPI002931A31E|nr:ribonuclease pancreatic-like [Heteronotia binoei]